MTANGFRPGSTVYHITFEDDDHPLHGLDVRIRSCKLKELRLMDNLTSASRREEDPEEREQALIDLFLGKMVSWNLASEDGEPLPITQETLDDEEPSLMFGIIMEWYKAMVQVSVPLPSDYSNGRSSQEASLGLASRSESLGN